MSAIHQTLDFVKFVYRPSSDGLYHLLQDYSYTLDMVEPELCRLLLNFHNIRLKRRGLDIIKSAYYDKYGNIIIRYSRPKR